MVLQVKAYILKVKAYILIYTQVNQGEENRNFIQEYRMFLTYLVPLGLSGIYDLKNIYYLALLIFNHPVNHHCRLIRFSFIKEKFVVLRQVETFLITAIASLVRANVENLVVLQKLEITMIVGKDAT